MRLIDADAFIVDSIKERRFVFYKEDLFNDEIIVKTVYSDLIDAIEKAPTVEAEPVRNGCEYCSGGNVEYQYTTYAKLYMDTVLGEKVLVAEGTPCPPYANCCMKGVPVRSVFRINYCPNCGAKMDKCE